MVIYTVLHNLSRHSVQQGSVNKCVENLHVMLKKANIMFLVCEGLANIENDFCTQLVMNEIILQTFRFQPGKVAPNLHTYSVHYKIIFKVAESSSYLYSSPLQCLKHLTMKYLCKNVYFNRKGEAAFNIDNEQRQVYIYGNIPRNYMYMKFGLKICFALVSLENVNSVFSVHSVTVNEVLKQFVFLVHGCV